MPDKISNGVMQTLEPLSALVSVPVRLLPIQLSELMAGFVSHSALVILAADAAGGARYDAGDQDITRHISFLLLDQLRHDGQPGTARNTTIDVSGTSVSVLVLFARNGALLVLVSPGDSGMSTAAPSAHIAEADSTVSTALYVWNIVAHRVQESADSAPPAYLQQARLSSGARMEALAELTDEYSTTLESALAALRSTTLDDRAARVRATRIAGNGLMRLRLASDRVRTVTEEPVTTAFTRLRDDLRPLTGYRSIEVQFVEPPSDGRALPAEVAHGARAVVRSSILVLIDRPSVSRVRVKWDCDGTNLIINMRDDGPGDLTEESSPLQLVLQRIYALNGRIQVHATPGWGTEMAIVIPLDPPSGLSALPRSWGLRPREQEVLELVASGLRNREIASRLQISENTVKFHLARIYRQLGVGTRTEATALYLAQSGPPRSSSGDVRRAEMPANSPAA